MKNINPSVILTRVFGFFPILAIFFFASYFGVKIGFDLLVYQYQIPLVWFILIGVILSYHFVSWIPHFALCF